MEQHNVEAVHMHLIFIDKKVEAQDRKIVEMEKQTNFLNRWMSFLFLSLFGFEKKQQKTRCVYETPCPLPHPSHMVRVTK